MDPRMSNADRDFPGTVRKPGTVYFKPDYFFICSRCGKETKYPFTEGTYPSAYSHYGLIVLAIHWKLMWQSREKDNIRYKDTVRYEEGVYQILVKEEIHLCENCVPRTIKDVVKLVAQNTHYSEYDLEHEKIHAPDFNRELGHCVTLIEYGPALMGRYFNIQVNQATFERIIRGLPLEILESHGISRRLKIIEERYRQSVQ